MAKLYGWEETIFSFMKFGENFILIGSSNAMMVVFFLSGINLSNFFPLNPKIYRIGKAPNILCSRCKEQMILTPSTPRLPFLPFIFYQAVQNYCRII